MKIAFIKYAGMASGGIEKYLQTIACELPKIGFDVDFYYTNVAPIVHNSNFQHPQNSEKREKFVLSHGVNLIKCRVNEKNGGNIPYEWIDTDFWAKFKEGDYDLIVTGRGGYTEYPFNLINKTTILDTIHSFTGEDKPNIWKSILLCEWQRYEWGRNGGNLKKSVIIPSLVYIPDGYDTCGDMKEKLGIPKDSFVYGFHQGNRDDIFSHVSLSSFQELQDDSYFLIMGGSDKYKELAHRYNNPRIKFVDFSDDPMDIHRFLNTLNVFAHARADGEVCSAAIIEALAHGLPVVSHPALNMGHYEQIKDCGFLEYTIDGYRNRLKELKNLNLLSELSKKAKEKYKQKYQYNKVMGQILNIFEEFKS